jgi:hypothetical protein
MTMVDALRVSLALFAVAAEDKRYRRVDEARLVVVTPG